MNTSTLPAKSPVNSRRKGLALVLVLTSISLCMILLVALLSTSQTELTSTAASARGASARLYADTAVSLVIGQIQSASQPDAATAGIETWTSQPGMVRQYQENGQLLKGNKLYSDQKMVATTEAEIINDTPPADWDTLPERYVDINEPVARRDANQPGAPPRWFYPIIDPRAYANDPSKSVEGFTYSQYANGISGQALNGVTLPNADNPDAQRLPMPVEWLYQLKDGTLGFLDEENTFVGPAGAVASNDNPIVSRIAFWTDDESCKININTAAEGTAWDTPRLYHERDGDWAKYQPMSYEYQRYPGHPAMVSMSSVLFPHENMNPPKSDTAQFEKSLDFKEQIYDLIPKILPGGSRSGSVIVPAGRNFSPTDFKEVQHALDERLFASVDEFLLRAKIGEDGQRQEVQLNNSGAWSGLTQPEVLQRLRPFLTPRSRSPEMNPFGMPKIAMWPLHVINNEQYRSVFDRTIAYCSTLGGKNYYFTRQNSNSQTELSTILRNRQLFDYLLDLTARPIPGFAINTAANFENKYGDNRQQILIEIFDYIRSTNLYDDTIAEASVGDTPTITSLPTARQTAYATNGGLASKTFTPMRISQGSGTNSSFPGHGQVLPTVLPKGPSEVYRGMGRFFTISEAGLHFIATAQGNTRAGGVSAAKIVPTSPPAEANYTPPSWRGNEWGDSNNWYSNFPPLSEENQDPANGFYMTKYPANHRLEEQDGNSPDHPGYNPMNWNWTLDKDTPLANNVKRIQATFLLEWFCPSAGWAIINPDFAIEVDASALRIGGKPMFPLNGGRTLIRPFKNMSQGNGIHQRGGTTSYRAFLQERKLPAVATGLNGYTSGSILFDDTNIPSATQVPYSTNTGHINYSTYASQSGVLKQCNQYNLVSDFIDVPGGDLGKISFTGGVVTVKILTNTATPTVLQTFNFNFPTSQFPSPLLTTQSTDTTWSQNADGSWVINQPVPAPYWWAFHSDGALGRDKNGRITQTAAVPASRMGGRFRYIGNEIGNYTGANSYRRGNLAILDDTIQSLVLRHGDPRLTMGQYNVPVSEFERHRLYGQQRMAHNIVLRHWSEGPGLDQGLDKKGWRLVKDADYYASFLPDHPYSPACGAGLQKYGDFDRGITNQTDGAYINKPDEGNSYSVISSSDQEQLVPYFSNSYNSWTGGSSYFSPNRQVASPGMFGSLPTGIHNAGASPAGKRREPWRTLLFRPQTWSTKRGQQFHIGAPQALKGYGVAAAGLPIQGVNPPDYLFMDFFWMPIVEPYAISSPGSTAGKINMNYQMAPFRHIRRTTGLHALMKSEILTAVSHADANVYLRRPTGAPKGAEESWFWKEDTSASGKKFWHRQIDTEATLKLFDERFKNGFAFISPAQICEMYLLPKRTDPSDTLVPNQWPDQIANLLKATSADSILKFWEEHAITAENLKERPYTNLYPRLTTRSNTYQVFVRTQVIRKARSSDPTKFETGKDQIGAEYRGSAVIERYLDQNDPQLLPASGLDFAVGNMTTKPHLDELHRFRVIAQTRFDP
ncbi:uncharacterized protein (TIGR02600 family) [Prosthecobacter fusiformis]|uniref:Uncharacterized protein (TIGR02600 family) n=1 Tax=Prosthecobacter fusiformis TaxID=48464 RepID=A0A4R7SRG3_9BACT|nr:Verru_Chthon cassette protein A [Prosthecobacter fusiformis]TDU80757.1 uncharacterized protein (TIGR02600 family) [Prosthecobacter fusiformis]